VFFHIFIYVVRVIIMETGNLSSHINMHPPTGNTRRRAMIDFDLLTSTSVRAKCLP